MTHSRTGHRARRGQPPVVGHRHRVPPRRLPRPPAAPPHPGDRGWSHVPLGRRRLRQLCHRRAPSSGAPHDCDGHGERRWPALESAWQGSDLERSRRCQPRGAQEPGVCRAQTDLSRSGPCHDLLRSGRLSQSWGTPALIRVPERTGRRGRPSLVWPEGFALTQVVKAGLHCGRGEGIVWRVVVGTEATVAAARAARHGGTTINTAYIERLNATLRERLVPLVHRRRAPAHGTALVEGELHLLRLAYNYCWAHESLRVRAIESGHRWAERTPAMAAGLAAHPYGLDELLRRPAHPVPLAAPRAPRRGRLIPFPCPSAAPSERSAA